MLLSNFATRAKARQEISLRPLPHPTPSLYHQLKQLPWRQIRVGHVEDHHGHGRT
jgi:hypothetical protein